ncbi:MAG: hypothetical protein RR605_00940 [Acinetobacter sp.]
MAKQYKALVPVGRFSKDDIVGGLSDAQIKKLVADGTIQEVPEEAKASALVKKVTTGEAK